MWVIYLEISWVFSDPVFVTATNKSYMVENKTKIIITRKHGEQWCHSHQDRHQFQSTPLQIYHHFEKQAKNSFQICTRVSARNWWKRASPNKLTIHLFSMLHCRLPPAKALLINWCCIISFWSHMWPPSTIMSFQYLPIFMTEGCSRRTAVLQLWVCQS